MEKAFKEYTREITLSRAIRVINFIQSVSFDRRGYCLYARGDTFKSRQEIQLLEAKFPIEIKIIESTKKGVWKIMPIPSPNYFVIKINKFVVLEDFYNSINDISIITFCIFNKVFESDFIKRMEKERQATYIEPMYQDSSYFAYGIDTDDQESESGLREFVSYGINAPRELISFL